MTLRMPANQLSLGSYSVTGRMDWNDKLADVLVKYCQPDVIRLLAWNSMVTFRKVILKAARNQRLKRDSSGFVFQLLSH